MPRRVGYTHVVLDADQKTIRFDRPGVELDLGGIAKGYAVDRVVGLLREHHVVAALVSAHRPFGVDVSSGVETSVRVKDPDLVGAFVQAVHNADEAGR